MILVIITAYLLVIISLLAGLTLFSRTIIHLFKLKSKLSKVNIKYERSFVGSMQIRTPINIVNKNTLRIFRYRSPEEKRINDIIEFDLNEYSFFQDYRFRTKKFKDQSQIKI